ncbi:c-type cytochrome biogenesis protein CcmI [Pelagibacterium lentulum]|uniref:C-type cytochrome biogenesis protein CcmI n=1 Tax=Pelagibacterium lentulum TaxID=2029865 RepID=A0A916RHM9_9HYPH|nr:c-type cytochrome biogenesis protein CcmI [Pelagibacterium lentulum]GGA54135.1 c-type cytochrome biogenesis protein CcmI [Pelagibacterium lentulum]
MLWIIAIGVAIACCVALLIAVRKRQDHQDETPDDAAARLFYKSQLEGIQEDLAGGRISEAEAIAAKAELAREVMRAKKAAPSSGTSRIATGVVLASLPIAAIAAIGLYVLIGRADLPAQPFAERSFAGSEQELTLETAIAQVEARMEETPNDIRGWLALAPIYMQAGRFEEAANAYRRVLSLEEPTADRETDLAEAIIMANDGELSAEAMGLLQSAAERDSQHVRSRFYIAGELTRIGAFEEAVPAWEYLLSLATGEEPWIPTAQSGLSAAQAGLFVGQLDEPVPDATQDVLIRGMVEGLAARLYDEGGSVGEWMQLVRSRNVLDGADAAQDDLSRALAEVDGMDRIALQDMAQELGLTTE